MANISFLMLRVESVMAPRITPTHIWPKRRKEKTKKSIVTYYRCITDSNLTLAILILHIHVWDNILTSMKATIFSRFLKTWWCVNQIWQINIDWSWFNAISGLWFYLIFISILDAISLWVCSLHVECNLISKGPIYLAIVHSRLFTLREFIVPACYHEKLPLISKA